MQIAPISSSGLFPPLTGGRSVDGRGCRDNSSRCQGPGRGQAIRWVLLAEVGAVQWNSLPLPVNLRRADPEVREARSRPGRQAEVIRPLCLGLLLLLAGPVGAATVLSVGDGDTPKTTPT